MKRIAIILLTLSFAKAFALDHVFLSQRAFNDGFNPILQQKMQTCARMLEMARSFQLSGALDQHKRYKIDGEYCFHQWLATWVTTKKSIFKVPYSIESDLGVLRALGLPCAPVTEKLKSGEILGCGSIDGAYGRYERAFLELIALIPAWILRQDILQSELIQRSKRDYNAPCPCPYDLDGLNNQCGLRSAYTQTGGQQPFCYLTDVPNILVTELRREKVIKSLCIESGVVSEECMGRVYSIWK